jgi:hypothetical protein
MNTDEDLIKLARIAGAHDNGVEVRFVVPLYLVRFAALLRDHMLSEGWRQCAQGQTTTQFCALAEQARLEEREACARVCESRYMGDNNREDMEARRCSAAIRARGQTSIQDPDDGNPSF